MDRNAGTPCHDWIAGLASISIRSDKVLTLAQPDRQGSERGTTHSFLNVPHDRGPITLS